MALLKKAQTETLPVYIWFMALVRGLVGIYGPLYSKNEKRLPNMVLSHQHSKTTTKYGAQSTTLVQALVLLTEHHIWWSFSSVDD